jgi:tripartite-type tricarboxylate transporter receptor subunit TctC
VSLGYPPTFATAGFIGLFAPARVPAEVQKRLAEVFAGVLADKAFQRRLLEIDTIPGWLGPDAFRAEIAFQLKEWSDLAAAMDLRVDG